MRKRADVGGLLTDVTGTGPALTNFLPHEALKEESGRTIMQHGAMTSHPLLQELENLSLSKSFS